MAAPRTGETTVETKTAAAVAVATKATIPEADTNQEEVVVTSQEVAACLEVAINQEKMAVATVEAKTQAGVIEAVIEVVEAAEAWTEAAAEEAMLQETTIEKMKVVLQTGAEVPLKTLNHSEEAEVDMLKVDLEEDSRVAHQRLSRRTTTKDLLSTSQTFVSKSTSRT